MEQTDPDQRLCPEEASCVWSNESKRVRDVNETYRATSFIISVSFSAQNQTQQINGDVFISCSVFCLSASNAAFL